MTMNDISACDHLVAEFEAVINKPKKNSTRTLYTGVDLGTACIVLAVMDENYQPVSGWGLSLCRCRARWDGCGLYWRDYHRERAEG